MNIKGSAIRQQVPSELQRNDFVAISQGETDVGRGEDIYLSAALHYMVVLPSVTLCLLLTAVFEKQRQIYPLPKDLGQA